MDILELWKSYEKGADPDDILPLYQQCPLRAKTRDYGELNLLQIACQNAHPEAVIWLLEQRLKPNQVSGYADLPLYQVATKGGLVRLCAPERGRLPHNAGAAGRGGERAAPG